MTVYLDLKLMEKMCHPFAVAFFDNTNDPIPDFKHHTKQLLESALSNPRHTFDSVDLYPTLSDKATILFYSLIKNHPFPNGNKRIATASLLVFLYINDKWLQVDHKELAEWAIKIAISGQPNSDSKEALIPSLKEWINSHTIDDVK